MKAPEAPKIQASLREPAEDAGQLWWGTFFEKRAAQINRRFSAAQIVYWSPSVKMPLDLFSYVREAALCFTVARFLATIVLSSSAVELILNRDRRTRGRPELKRTVGWATLNNQNLAIAGAQGLPVNVLVSEDEDLAGEQPVRFVARRNKVAHGEISQMFRNLTDYDPSAEQEALDQLWKSERFVVDWFNSAPEYRSVIFRITSGLTLLKPLARHNGLSGCQTLRRRVLDSKLNRAACRKASWDLIRKFVT